MVDDEFYHVRLPLQFHAGSSSAGAGRLVLLGSAEKADWRSHGSQIISPMSAFGQPQAVQLGSGDFRSGQSVMPLKKFSCMIKDTPAPFDKNKRAEIVLL